MKIYVAGKWQDREMSTRYVAVCDLCGWQGHPFYLRERAQLEADKHTDKPICVAVVQEVTKPSCSLHKRHNNAKNKY